MIRLFVIAWRNIFRNTLRSAAILFSVWLGLLAGIFSGSLVKGMMDSRFDNFIEKEISHIQIHHPLYVNRPEVGFYVANYAEISQRLLSIEGVKALSARTQIQGMIASATYQGGIHISGVDPNEEQLTTGFADQIIEGSFLEESHNALVIGKHLAEKMKVSLGSRVVVSFQDPDNNLISAAFTITGLFTTYYKRFDESHAFVHKSYLNKQLGIDNACHEMAILAVSPDRVPTIVEQAQELAPDLLVRSWDQIAPELLFWVEMGSTFSFIFITIILIGLAFGLLNTMLMAIFERTRELGMLMAIGMNKKKVFTLIVLETTILSISGALLGMLSAGILIQYLQNKGVNLSAFSDVMHEIGFETIIYPQWDITLFISLPFLVVLTSLIAAIYPAIKALKLSPAEAVRK